MTIVTKISIFQSCINPESVYLLQFSVLFEPYFFIMQFQFLSCNAKAMNLEYLYVERQQLITDALLVGIVSLSKVFICENQRLQQCRSIQQSCMCVVVIKLWLTNLLSSRYVRFSTITASGVLANGFRSCIIAWTGRPL